MNNNNIIEIKHFQKVCTNLNLKTIKTISKSDFTSDYVCIMNINNCI